MSLHAQLFKKMMFQYLTQTVVTSRIQRLRGE